TPGPPYKKSTEGPAHPLDRAHPGKYIKRPSDGPPPESSRGSNSVVECNLAKVDVEGSNPFSRSENRQAKQPVTAHAVAGFFVEAPKRELAEARYPRP